jgi:hypothetical protein
MSAKSINPPDSSDSGLNSQPAPIEIKKFTYGELREFHLKQLEKEGKSRQVIKNNNTAINKWLFFATWLNRERAKDERRISAYDDDLVGEELFLEFRRCLEEYVEEHKKPSGRSGDQGGYEEQTIYDRTGFIRGLQQNWLALLKTDGLPEGFGDAVNFLCAENKTTIGITSRRCNLPEGKLRLWVLEKNQPAYSSLKYITVLEEHFKLQSGALKSRLPNIMHGMGRQLAKSNRTPWRAHQGAVQKKRYLLTKLIDYVPKQIEAEWLDLLKFYTDGPWVIARGLKRSEESSGWRTHKITNRNRSAEKYYEYILYFAGYLSLPTEPENLALRGVKFDPENEDHVGVRGHDPHLVGKGVDPESFSLAFFTVTGWVYDYIVFKKERTFNQVYNEYVNGFLRFAAQLSRPGVGYLWQLPQFSSKLPPSDTAYIKLLRKSDEEAVRIAKRERRKETDDEREERIIQVWHQYCEAAYKRIIDFRNSIANDKNEGFKRSNDSMEVVKPIIRARRHPISVLLEMVEKLRKDAELTKDLERKAKLFRKLLLIHLIASNPMRIENIALMKYKEGCRGNEEDECNLYQKEDGSWHLKYEQWELKNGFSRGRYNLPIHSSVWKDIEEYLTVHRPRLIGAKECDFVFRQSMEYYIRVRSPEKRAQLLTKPMVSNVLSTQISKLSQLLIPGCLGFSAHAARHFAVTEWLKHHPGAYPVAAAIIHDSEQMARVTYNWVEPDDMAAFWHDHFGKIVAQFSEGGLG